MIQQTKAARKAIFKKATIIRSLGRKLKLAWHLHKAIQGTERYLPESTLIEKTSNLERVSSRMTSEQLIVTSTKK